MPDTPITLREAAQSAYDFLQDKSFIPDSDTHRCTAIVDALETALAPVGPVAAAEQLVIACARRLRHAIGSEPEISVRHRALDQAVDQLEAAITSRIAAAESRKTSRTEPDAPAIRMMDGSFLLRD